jgi:hypothetical protein
VIRSWTLDEAMFSGISHHGLTPALCLARLLSCGANDEVFHGDSGNTASHHVAQNQCFLWHSLGPKLVAQRAADDASTESTLACLTCY